MNKRKRSEKTVRFDVEHIVVFYTYSAMEYDRGGRYQSIQYKVNPNRKILPKLLVDIPPSNTTIRQQHTEDGSSPDSDDSIDTPTISTKKRKPQLSINTNICTDGPLFFTKLSTNGSVSDDDGEDILIPINP